MDTFFSTRPLQNFEHQPAFEVDHITNHRIDPKTNAYEYLVSWKRYPDDNSWEPVSSFDDIDPVRRYWGARHAGVEALKSAQRELKTSARARTKKRKAEREVAALQASLVAVPAASIAVPAAPAALPAASVAMPATSAAEAAAVLPAMLPIAPSVPTVVPAAAVSMPTTTAAPSAAHRLHRTQHAQRAPKRFHYNM